MSHWALQYSERVEVLEPVDLREKIAGMVRDLEKKYLEKRKEYHNGTEGFFGAGARTADHL